MAVVGIGIDIVEVQRISDMVFRHGDRFLHRVFTDREIAYCRSRKRCDEHLAARWAAKEAGIKALRLAFDGSLTLKDIEVERGESGEPRLKLHGGAGRFACSQGISQFHVTLSHVALIAVACVVAESDDTRGRSTED
jgi:holo-[acyl-carrier protein] synthase